MATCRRTQNPDTSHKPVKSYPKVPNVPVTLHTSEVRKHGTTQRFRGYFCDGCSLSGWVGGGFCAFFRFFYGFRTCRVGHLECTYLIPHISNFSSKFCNIDCLTLQTVSEFKNTYSCHSKIVRYVGIFHLPEPFESKSISGREFAACDMGISE